MKTKDLSYCGFSFVLLVVCAKVSIPFGFIPLTLQTLAVILCGLLLNRKQIIFTFSTYLLAGLCGLPVFANGGGFAYVLQPSFGFLLSFPIAAYMLSANKKHFDTLFKMMIYAIFALLIIYTIGALYMYVIFINVLMINKNIIDVLTIGVLPFVFNDTVSTMCACVLAQRITCIVPYFRNSSARIQ